MRQPVRPIRQFLVGALAPIADQRDAVAVPLLDQAVGQLDRGVEIFRILKLRPVQVQFRPLRERRKIAPRKIIDMTGRAQRWIRVKNRRYHFLRSRSPRHCERSEAIQFFPVALDCFVASAPRNDGSYTILPSAALRAEAFVFANSRINSRTSLSPRSANSSAI